MVAFLAGVVVAYVGVGVALLVRDAKRQKVNGLLKYPLWPKALWKAYE
jgi:hypothetical protein